MQEINEGIFSKEEFEKVSNIIENNSSILLKNTEYCNQEKEISNLYETICSKIKNTELENIFENYNNITIDHILYELTLIYNIGIITGMDLSDMKKEIKAYSEQYCSKKIVDFSKYLNQTQLDFLKTLKIFIENKLYTEEEFELIKRGILFHINTNKVSKEDEKELLEIFSKISNDYSFKE